MMFVGGLILAVALLGGVDLLTQGYDAQAVPAFLVPIAIVVLAWVFWVRGMRRLISRIPPLLDDVSELLEATPPAYGSPA